MPYALRIPASPLQALGPVATMPAPADALVTALVNLPAVQSVLDPASSYLPTDANGKLYWQDRTNRKRYRTSGSAALGGQTNPTLSAAINGKPTLQLGGATALVPDAPESLNPLGFTIATVIKPDSTVASASRALIGTSDLAANGATDFIAYLGLQMGGNAASTLRVFRGDNVIRSTCATTIAANAAALVLLGYSIAGTVTGNLTNGSAQISGVSGAALAAVTPGMPVGSAVAGIPANTTVASVAGDVITLSAAFTGTTTAGASIQIGGFRWRVNGAPAGATADLNGLNKPGFNLFQNRQTAATTYIGAQGHLILAAADYTAPVYAQALALLESNLRSFYNL